MYDHRAILYTFINLKIFKYLPHQNKLATLSVLEPAKDCYFQKDFA